MIETVFKLWSVASGIRTRVQQLSRSVDLLERNIADAARAHRVTRLIVSGSKFWVFEGTEADLEHQVAQIAAMTRSCVSVAAFVSHSHRKGCTACPDGGVVREGN